MLASVVPETGIGIYAELALEHHFRGPLRLLASSGADTLFVCMEDLERDSPKHVATGQKVRDHLLGPTPTDAAPLALPSTGIKYTGPHATAAQVSSPERTRLLDALDEIDRTHLNGALRRAQAMVRCAPRTASPPTADREQVGPVVTDAKAPLREAGRKNKTLRKDLPC